MAQKDNAGSKKNLSLHLLLKVDQREIFFNRYTELIQHSVEILAIDRENQ